MHRLYELKSRLCEELESYAGKELNRSNIEAVDTIAHACKNICKIIDYCEENDSENGSYGEYSPYRNRMYGGVRIPDPMMYPDGRYGTRGRRGASRDSIGRYSEYGHDSAQIEEIAMDLHKISDKLPENIRGEVMKIADKLRGMEA